MIITYYGKQFFKVSHGETTIAINPISKESKEKGARFGADIALITTNHPDYNGAESVAYGDREPFTIKGPGDYEIDDIFIKGVMTETEIGGKKYINTIYSFTVDSINIAFFGALGKGNISSDAKEAIGSPDIIFIPIGGNGLLNALEAHKLALSFDPHLIIPMDFGGDMDSNALKTFLKEGGEEAETFDKLTIKKKDLEKREADIIVLSAN